LNPIAEKDPVDPFDPVRRDLERISRIDGMGGTKEVGKDEWRVNGKISGGLHIERQSLEFQRNGSFAVFFVDVDNGEVRHKLNHMKTATVRELRNEFPRIEAWVHEGETIHISKRGKVIAALVPVLGSSDAAKVRPKVDIMDRLRKTWSGRVFTKEEVAAMRADELAGDLG
jgi:antitoxin (DNA-binding transcriptional repressor) of toxin-antitoxin stability system